MKSILLGYINSSDTNSRSCTGVDNKFDTILFSNRLFLVAEPDRTEKKSILLGCMNSF